MLFREDLFNLFATDIVYAIFAGMLIFGFLIIYYIFSNLF